MRDGERQAALEQIADEVRVCTRCRLHQQRTRSVPGEGNPDTEVVFVGEGPGFNEDREGRPFVGRAGGLLVKLLASIGWLREDVFITNVVKCRPPGNRDPEADEIAACAPFLQRQLAALDPALVVTLGRFSMATFMPGARIGQAHGTMRPVDSASGASDALAFAMYHPAAALRATEIERTSFQDMAAVPSALLKARESREHHSAGGVAAAEAAAPSALADVPAAVESVAAAVPGPLSQERFGEASAEPAPAEYGPRISSDGIPSENAPIPGGMTAYSAPTPEFNGSWNIPAAPEAAGAAAPAPEAAAPTTAAPIAGAPTTFALEPDPITDQLTLF